MILGFDGQRALRRLFLKRTPDGCALAVEFNRVDCFLHPVVRPTQIVKHGRPELIVADHRQRRAQGAIR